MIMPPLKVVVGSEPVTLVYIPQAWLGETPLFGLKYIGNQVLIHSTMSLLFSHPDPHQQELYKKYCEFLPPITSGATEGNV